MTGMATLEADLTPVPPEAATTAELEAPALPSPDTVRRELGELLSDKMEDIYGAHEAWGTGERHIKHLRSRPTYRVRAEMRRAEHFLAVI
jgi:hypothetical protein